MVQHLSTAPQTKTPMTPHSNPPRKQAVRPEGVGRLVHSWRVETTPWAFAVSLVLAGTNAAWGSASPGWQSEEFGSAIMSHAAAIAPPSDPTLPSPSKEKPTKPDAPLKRRPTDEPISPDKPEPNKTEPARRLPPDKPLDAPKPNPNPAVRPDAPVGPPYVAPKPGSPDATPGRRRSDPIKPPFAPKPRTSPNDGKRPNAPIRSPSAPPGEGPGRRPIGPPIEAPKPPSGVPGPPKPPSGTPITPPNPGNPGKGPGQNPGGPPIFPPDFGIPGGTPGVKPPSNPIAPPKITPG
jgi:hypothetical protein